MHHLYNTSHQITTPSYKLCIQIRYPLHGDIRRGLLRIVSFAPDHSRPLAHPLYELLVYVGSIQRVNSNSNRASCTQTNFVHSPNGDSIANAALMRFVRILRMKTDQTPVSEPLPRTWFYWFMVVLASYSLGLIGVFA